MYRLPRTSGSKEPKITSALIVARWLAWKLRETLYIVERGSDYYLSFIKEDGSIRIRP